MGKPEYYFLKDTMWTALLTCYPCRCGAVATGVVLDLGRPGFDRVCADCADDVLTMRQLECLVSHDRHG